MNPTILLAYGHRIARAALRKLIEAEPGLSVIGEASDGGEVVEFVPELKPDVVIMDRWLRRLCAVEATRRIVESGCRARIVILPLSGPHDRAAETLRAGARAYLTEDSSPEELVTAIRTVVRQQSYLAPKIADRIIDALSAPEVPVLMARLTRREREVCQRIAEGSSTKEVAVDLGISVRTAESYRAALMSKLDVHNVSELVRLAIREGLILP